MSVSAENDPHGTARFEHEYQFQRAARAKRQAVSDHHKASKLCVNTFYPQRGWMLTANEY